MATQPPRSSLLGLPREVRDHILSYLLLHAQEPPANPSVAGPRKRGQRDVMFPINDPALRFTNVAGVNRQLHAEMIDHTDSLYKKGEAVAELDLMAKGYLFYPTWTRLPVFLRCVKPFDLKVNLRIISTESFHSNDGWPRQPGAGLRRMYALLNNLLRNGPSLAFSEGPITETVPYRINTLTINISFQDPYTPNTWPETADIVLSQLRLLADSGILHTYVGRICAHCRYDTSEGCCEESEEWPVAQLDGWGPAGLDNWEDYLILACS